MTPTSSVHTRRYFIANTVIGAAIVNALINAAFGWLATLELPLVPLWGVPSVAVDTVLTAFGVAFGTALVVVHQARKDMFAGKAWPREPQGWVGRIVAALPEGYVPRALWLGAVSVLLFVPLPVACLSASGVRELGAEDFVVFKTVFSAVEGALVTPLVALHGMVTGRGRSI